MLFSASWWGKASLPEVTLEQRADQVTSKPCNSLGNEYFQLGNNKGKDLKILPRESAWSVQKTV